MIEVKLSNAFLMEYFESFQNYGETINFIKISLSCLIRFHEVKDLKWRLVAIPESEFLNNKVKLLWSYKIRK